MNETVEKLRAALKALQLQLEGMGQVVRGQHRSHNNLMPRFALTRSGISEE